MGCVRPVPIGEPCRHPIMTDAIRFWHISTGAELQRSTTQFWHNHMQRMVPTQFWHTCRRGVGNDLCPDGSSSGTHSQDAWMCVGHGTASCTLPYIQKCYGRNIRQHEPQNEWQPEAARGGPCGHIIQHIFWHLHTQHGGIKCEALRSWHTFASRMLTHITTHTHAHTHTC